MKSRKFIVAGATAAVAALAAPGSALALDQPVTGTTATTIALSAPTTATFGVGLSPGSTANSTGGTVTAADTNSSWTLSAKDGAAVGANGKMDAAALGCTNSPAELANALGITVTPVVANAAITPTARSLSSLDQTVASATAVPLAATVFTTAFSQAVGSSEALQAGCVYSLTATYTLA
ncbi:MAG TPA: hypothetical protein VIL64_02095 [Solirubrobacteraceae bacterium]|jgi:hypothetical protein